MRTAGNGVGVGGKVGVGVSVGEEVGWRGCEVELTSNALVGNISGMRSISVHAMVMASSAMASKYQEVFGLIFA